MAKKLINVVYKVDDSELLKAKASITQVAAETKKSELAMTALSQETTKSGLKISNTYEGMKLQLAQLRGQIDSTKQSDTARLQKLTADYVEVKKKVDDFNKSLQDTGKSAENSVNIFKSLSTTIATIFTVAAVKQVFSMGLEMNKLAGEVAGVEKAFKRAFPNSALLMNDLRKSTHGAVTDFELMKRTLQGTNLGVSVEHLGTLFEFAAARAQQTGESVDYLVDSIVRGIGRKSILVLDNLGLSATRLKEQFNGASIASKSVAEVTAGVAAIAKIELEKMGGYTETAATKVAQLATNWDTFKQVISEKGSSGAVVGALATALQNLTNAIIGQEEVTKRLAAEQVSSLGITSKTKEGITEEIKRRKEKIEGMEKELKAIQDRNQELINKHSPATIKEQDQLKEGYKAISEILKIRREEITVIENYVKSLDSAKKPQKEEIGYIQNIKDEIEKLNDQIDKASRDKLPGLQSKLDALQKQLKVAQLLRPIAIPTDEENAARDAQHDAKDLADIIADTQDDTLKSQEDFNKKIEAAEKELHDNLKKQDKDAEEERKEQSDRERKREIEEIEKHNREKAQLQKAFQNFVFNSIDQILTASLINRRDDSDDISEYYDKQIEAAGKNDKAVKALEEKRSVALNKERQRQLEADREAAITKIEIDALVAAARQFVDYSFPVALGFAAIIAASAAVQIATIKSIQSKSLKTRAFAKGGIDIDGPGSGTSDSIPAWLSKGESVINAQATAGSKNLLEAINERRIDDRILQQIAVNGGSQAQVFDDSKLIRAIENSRVDLVKHGTTLMEVRHLGQNLKRITRAKMINR